MKQLELVVDGQGELSQGNHQRAYVNPEAARKVCRRPPNSKSRASVFKMVSMAP